MKNPPDSGDLEGVVLDEQTVLTLTELTTVCGVDTEQVRLMVGEGMLQPAGGRPEHWRFTGIEVRRTRRALRLQRDLDLNLSGTALALDLIDEIEALRRRLRALENDLSRPEDAD